MDSEKIKSDKNKKEIFVSLPDEAFRFKKDIKNTFSEEITLILNKIFDEDTELFSKLAK